MPYLQSSTQNPYGHRPWQTRLYTGFANYSYLKQPQNTILRGNQAMRPEIYKPPELPPAGVGAVTVVTGSGRVVARARRRRQLLGAVSAYSGLPASQMIRIGPIVDGTMPVRMPPMPMPGPMPVYPGAAPIYSYPGAPPSGVPVPFVPAPISSPVPVSPPMYPPTIVPPVPTPVASSDGTTLWMYPGTPATPGSPFMPATPEGLPIPGAAPAVAPTPGTFMDWFQSATWIAGVPNGYLLLGGVAAIYLFGKRGRR